MLVRTNVLFLSQSCTCSHSDDVCAYSELAKRSNACHYQMSPGALSLTSLALTCGVFIGLIVHAENMEQNKQTNNLGLLRPDQVKKSRHELRTFKSWKQQDIYTLTLCHKKTWSNLPLKQWFYWPHYNSINFSSHYSTGPPCFHLALWDTSPSGSVTWARPE